MVNESLRFWVVSSGNSSRHFVISLDMMKLCSACKPLIAFGASRPPDNAHNRSKHVSSARGFWGLERGGGEGEGVVTPSPPKPQTSLRFGRVVTPSSSIENMKMAKMTHLRTGKTFKFSTFNFQFSNLVCDTKFEN